MRNRAHLGIIVFVDPRPERLCPDGILGPQPEVQLERPCATPGGSFGRLGINPLKLRQLFDQARKEAPAIIFLEIDSITSKREHAIGEIGEIEKSSSPTTCIDGLEVHGQIHRPNYRKCQSQNPN